MAKDLFTEVGAPGMPAHYGYSFRERLTRKEAIDRYRAMKQCELEDIQKILAMPENELVARVVRGVYVQDVIEELRP